MIDYSVYLITDRRWLEPGKKLYEAVEEAILGGATIIQYREKEFKDEMLKLEAISVLNVCRKYNIPLIINDNVYLAKEIGADGVHLGQSDMEIEKAREILGKDAIIGVTAKTVELARKAENSSASYLGSGAVFGSSTKTDAKPMSLGEFKNICTCVTIPVVAIGGINETNISQLRGCKMSGFALVSAVFSKKDIKSATETISELAHNILN